MGCGLAPPPSPPPEAESQAGDSQSLKARGNLNHRDGILHQTVSSLPVTNQVFLGSWTVDIHQEGHSQRSPPQSQLLSVLGAQWEHCLRCAVVSSEVLISGCDLPDRYQPSRIPGRLG